MFLFLQSVQSIYPCYTAPLGPSPSMLAKCKHCVYPSCTLWYKLLKLGDSPWYGCQNFYHLEVSQSSHLGQWRRLLVTPVSPSPAEGKGDKVEEINETAFLVMPYMETQWKDLCQPQKKYLPDFTLSINVNGHKIVCSQQQVISLYQELRSCMTKTIKRRLSPMTFWFSNKATYYQLLLLGRSTMVITMR